MRPFSKKGLWVMCMVVVLAGGLFLMDLPIERGISTHPPASAQMAYSTQDALSAVSPSGILPGDVMFSGMSYGLSAPGDVMFGAAYFAGDIIFPRSSFGGQGTKLTTIMTCGGWCQTMSTCSWNCGATFSYCGTAGSGSWTGQGTTISTCAGSQYGSCGVGTSMTCGSMLGSCGRTSTTCSGLFGGCGGMDTTNTTCGSLWGCTSTMKTCGVSCPINKDTMLDCRIIVGETQLTCIGCSETMFNCENTKDTCNILTCRTPTTGTCAGSISCGSTMSTCGNCLFQFTLETTKSPAF